VGIEYRMTAANGEWPMTKQEMHAWLAELVERHRLPGIVQLSDNNLEITSCENESAWLNVIISVEATGFFDRSVQQQLCLCRSSYLPLHPPACITIW
jgi:hypothetical protein